MPADDIPKETGDDLVDERGVITPEGQRFLDTPKNCEKCPIKMFCFNLKINYRILDAKEQTDYCPLCEMVEERILRLRNEAIRKWNETERQKPDYPEKQ